MILDDDDAVPRFGRRAQDAGRIERLDGIGVQDARFDTLLLEGIISLQRFDERDPGRHDESGVLTALSQDLGAADRKRFLFGIKDGRRGPARPDIAHPLVSGGLRDAGFRGEGIARIKNDAAGNGPELAQVLEPHLGRPVLADADADMRAANLDVGQGIPGHAELIVGPGQEGRE